MSNRKLENDAVMRDLMFGREFLSDEKHWCKNVCWRDESGVVIDYRPEIKDIHSACILGAVSMGSLNCKEPQWFPQRPDAADYIDSLWKVNHVTSISYWNDKAATHKDILIVLDETIEQRKTELLAKVTE